MKNEGHKELSRIEEVEALLADTDGEVYVRWSRGPETDTASGGRSRNQVSGDLEAGLSVNPLRWAFDLGRAMLATTLMEYRYCCAAGNGVYGWLCTGREVGRGGDNEPCIEVGDVLGYIGRDLIAQIESNLTVETTRFQGRVSRVRKWGD